jgi:hypothetical protein
MIIFNEPVGEALIFWIDVSINQHRQTVTVKKKCNKPYSPLLTENNPSGSKTITVLCDGSLFMDCHSITVSRPSKTIASNKMKSSRLTDRLIGVSWTKATSVALE